VTRSGDVYSVMGAAWGGPIAAVEVRIDEGEWQSATITEGDDSDFTWAFWSLDWGTPTPGEHLVTSRAIDEAGQIQPAPDDPYLTSKTTFWEANGQITRQIRIE
jgi:hypothetical protein